MRKSLKEKVRERFDGQCFFCGRYDSGRKPLHCHHINGDDSDNRIDNLILLCASCHISIHRKDEEPYRPFHRALPPKHRHTPNAYDGPREPLKIDIDQMRLTRHIDTGLKGHYYRKTRGDWNSKEVCVE